MYKNIILPVVLYGCETGFLMLRDEYRLRMFENGGEEDIWTEDGSIYRRVEKTAQRGASCFGLFAKYN
jgi:hypothetical protein